MLIKQDIDSRITALRQLAQRWETSGGTSRREWEADAANYVAQQAGHQAIEWVDSSLHVRWIVPLEGNEAAQNLDITSLDEPRLAVIAARNTRTVTLTQPFELLNGANGFGVAMPLFLQDQFDGLVVAIFRTNEWLDSVLKDIDQSDFLVRVVINNQAVYPQLDNGDPVDAAWVQHGGAETHSFKWTTRVSPTAEFLAVARSQFSTTVLILGQLLSVLMAMAVYAALTSRYRASQLRVSTDRIETLFENLPDMAYRCANHKSWPMQFVSDGCQALCGYDRGDLEEKRVLWGDLIHPDDRDRVWNSVQSALQADEQFELEYRIGTKHDEERWVRERGTATQSIDSDEIFLEGFITNITHRKRAESELIRAQAHAQAIVDTVVEAVISFDTRGRIESINRAAQAMYGYTFEEIKGQSVAVLMTDALREEFDRYLEHTPEIEASVFHERGRELAGKCKDNSVFPIHLSVGEVLDQTERRFVTLIRDKSTQKAAEREAKQHRDQLAHVERLNTFGEMATGIAHEINQPLSAISMYAQSSLRFLDGATPKPDKLRAALEKLSVQAHRAGAVIDRIQGLSRQRGSERKAVDCNTLIKDIAKLAEREAHIRDLVIDVKPAGDVLPVMCDPIQIQQVALNLLRNGMEAMVSAGCQHGIRIMLSACRAGNEVKISVSDSGSGVSEQVAEQLFQPFSSTKGG